MRSFEASRTPHNRGEIVRTLRRGSYDVNEVRTPPACSQATLNHFSLARRRRAYPFQLSPLEACVPYWVFPRKTVKEKAGRLTVAFDPMIKRAGGSDLIG